MVGTREITTESLGRFSLGVLETHKISPRQRFRKPHLVG